MPKDFAVVKLPTVETDMTEQARMRLTAEINANAGEREALEQEHGTVWNTDELTQAFDVLAFCAPRVSVRRRSDGVKGLLTFQHRPRFYYNFVPAK